MFLSVDPDVKREDGSSGDTGESMFAVQAAHCFEG
jgi:hypothetical protein